MSGKRDKTEQPIQQRLVVGDGRKKDIRPTPLNITTRTTRSRRADGTVVETTTVTMPASQVRNRQPK